MDLKDTNTIVKVSSQTDGDVTLIAGNFPILPNSQVVRGNILSTLEEIFDSGVQVVGIEGAEEIGKTTLLAQFAKRHAQHSISLFVKATDLFAYDPQLLLRDLCNQIRFIISGREISDEEQTDEGMFRDLLFGLYRMGRRKNTDFFFIVDGFEDTVTAAQTMKSVMSLLPIGAAHIKFLISAPEKILREFLRRGILYKSFILPGFALEETISYFSDLNVSTQFIDELFRICSRGVPGQFASVRRILESGVTPEALLSELPERLPDLFELEWKTVDLRNELALDVLALISQTEQKHSLLDLTLILSIEPNSAREILGGLGFIHRPVSDDGPIEFVSDRVRRFVATKLASRRSRVRDLAIQAFLKTPESDRALATLPTYLEETGRWELLLSYLSPSHFTAMIERSGSLLPMRQNADLGVSTAFRLGRDGDLLRFSVQRAAMMEFDRISTLRSEANAWLALGEYRRAVAVAQGAALNRDRLRLFAAIARFQKEQGLTVEPEILDQLDMLADQVTPDDFGGQVVSLASDLMYSKPELGIKSAEWTPNDARNESAHDWAFARLSVDAMLSTQRENAGMSGISRGIIEKIKNPQIRQFSAAISFLFRTYSGADILSEVQKLKTPSDKLFLLRLWCLHNERKSDSADIIEYALRLLISTAEIARPRGTRMN